jgi:S1-C subfamily serine protease
VIEGAQEIRVPLDDRRELRAKLVGADPKTDLAVLKLPGSGFEVLPLADSGRVEVAEMVLAIGNPFGLAQTVTMGIAAGSPRASSAARVTRNFERERKSRVIALVHRQETMSFLGFPIVK